MKKIFFISSIAFMLFAWTQEGFAQNPQTRTRQRSSEAAVDNTPVLTERAKIKNEGNSKQQENPVWLREIYRNIDLTKENNAALYYPPQPIGDRKNLFTLIFKLVADGKLTGYNYREEPKFIESEIADFEEILKKFQILYTVQGTGDNKRFLVDDRDIPGNEALLYQIKEGWYFDQATGSFKSQISAICPLLVREDYNTGITENLAVFWIPYNSLRPYLSREMIMTSDYNNALVYSMDDYFTKRMFTGDIIKTVNLKNETLAQQIGSTEPEVLKLAQDSIEKQLKAFEKQLWVQEDTTKVAVDKKGKPIKASKEKVEKPKATKPEKPEKSDSAPTKSVRRTR
jgi:gliding motility associated protien GldN